MDINTGRGDPAKRVLIVTAVPAERDALLRGLQGDGRFEVVSAGVGAAAAAACTAAALAQAALASADGYGLVVSAGIGGGFPDIAPVGSLVVADGIVAADLGAETPDGFLSLDELGFGSSRESVDAGLSARVAVALGAAGLAVAVGPVLTVSTATGTAATAEALASRVPGSAAEAMEGYGAAVAARRFGVPVMEIRSISNPVGPRDRASWRIQEALALLETAGSIIREVLP